MEISEIKHSDVMVVGIKGRVDSTNCNILQKRLITLTETEVSMLVDCGEMDYISSAGLGALLLLLKTMQKKGGRLRLCSLNPRIREVFEISGFSKIFSIFPNREAVWQNDFPPKTLPES